jgi:signal transduction histidine kinase
VLSGERPRESSELLLTLSRDIGPRRDLAVRVSDDIQSINRSAFIQQQIETAALYSATQRRMWQRLGLALLASSVIAVIATMYVGRLERDLTRRRARERQTTEELQRLSTRLVFAQEEERRTIARELHDEVGQVLMAIKMELTLAQRAIEGHGGSGRLLDDAQAIADGALHTVRDLSHLLHPSLLDDLGLPAAVEWYLTGFGKRHAIRVALAIDGMEERLAPEMESTFFRIVQEALANIARHANATRCDISLRCDNETLTLVVEDDGVGFDLESRTSHRRDLGLGLVGIRERASALGGHTRVDTAPGRGTRLIVEMPRRSRPAIEDSDEAAADIKAIPSLEMTRG